MPVEQVQAQRETDSRAILVGRGSSWVVKPVAVRRKWFLWGGFPSSTEPSLSRKRIPDGRPSVLSGDPRLSLLPPWSPVLKKITSQKNKLAFVFSDTASLFQIHIDIPRTNPLIPLFQQPLVQEVREVLTVLSPSPPYRHGTRSACRCPGPPSGRGQVDG